MAGKVGLAEESDGGAVGGGAVGGGAVGGGICPVDSIVWVRRRNGSWWPGRILGMEELPASQLVPPKSGTPVKLLGRDDASVEWYNLEKSIRVKPFRCGEFDDCIERAEASHGIPIKRREKYARREDAILHALELERKQLEKLKKSETISNNINNETPSAMNSCPLEDYTSNTEIVGFSNFSDHKPQILPRKLLPSPEEDNLDNSLSVNKGRYGKPSEDDVPENTPRTRGLQDFGLRIAPPKKKHFEFVAWDNLQKNVDDHVGDLPVAEHGVGGQRHAGSSKGSIAIKRKTSQVGLLDESPAKRRDRRRPLVQVLESSAKLQSYRAFQPDHDVNNITTQGEKDHMGAICRAKRSKCIYLPAEFSDSPDHVGYSLREKPKLAHSRLDSYQPGTFADGNTSSGFEVEYGSCERDDSGTDMRDEENLLTDTRSLVPGHKRSGRDASCNSMVPQVNPNEQIADASIDVGVSKWYMKGKRNSRNLVKSPVDMLNGNCVDKYNSPTEASYESKKTEFKMGRRDTSTPRDLGDDLYPEEEFNYAYNGEDLIDDEATHTPLTGQRHASSLKAAKGETSGFIDSDDDTHMISQAVWEVDGPSEVGPLTYWKDPMCSDRTLAEQLTDEMESTIVDVDLKARASYQGEHVPLVSLMSKLNGKAIIGHPVQVEILEDGSSASVLFRNESKLDGSRVPSPVWKTARRTAIPRVPRSNPTQSTLEGEDPEPLRACDLERKAPSKTAYSDHFSHQARLAKKSISHARRSASGKFQRKIPKSVSLSGKKTRTLSSLSIEQKHVGGNSSAKPVSGITKPVRAVPLIPLKVVFSRILEAVGRPSSVSNQALVTDSTARDPL